MNETRECKCLTKTQHDETDCGRRVKSVVHVDGNLMRTANVPKPDGVSSLQDLWQRETDALAKRMIRDMPTPQAALLAAESALAAGASPEVVREVLDEPRDDMHERETEPSLEAAPKTSLMYEELKKVLPDRTITDEDVAQFTSNVARVLHEIVEGDEDDEDDGAEVIPITRQQRRAAERAAAKEAERESEELVSMTKAQFQKLHRARVMLAALVRREGRVRIPQRELQIQKGDQLDVKVQENGDLLVTFKAG